MQLVMKLVLGFTFENLEKLSFKKSFRNFLVELFEICFRKILKNDVRNRAIDSTQNKAGIENFVPEKCKRILLLNGRRLDQWAEITVLYYYIISHYYFTSPVCPSIQSKLTRLKGFSP